ncbi:hded protein [Afipia carboxidovorans OM5]|uniref:Putative transmembrane protein n=1 Tax=Afipia carboxidovorans (strain ATCC 49405 / DSM 1227 / KCTC 32145 / OM5) TaxID=504832 RepID=B6JAU8_AFIC5|nr:HdeD family acid-resistance protein [Afipia carboxidovorans]ACI92022.1 hded protein [Afipia carboxidovorans OM5]AEI04120.1 putative transmembrane protein [Afipia carboxidovorans OM4]AEI07750.1 putative transmembrane protein [Afipia carboxidovorans OM5]BEV45274.1 HdeD family acid-resistance protein [Afipia carboxidovorans]
MSISSGSHHSLGGALHSLRAKWGWILALGIVYIVAGIIALGNGLLSTVLSVAIIGAVMFISGVFEIISAFQMKTWSSFFLWIVLGALYALAGIFVWANPLLAAGALTLLIGIALIASGLVRIFLAFRLPDTAPRFWICLSGAITVLLGAIILSQWPVSSLYVLGLFLGIDLLFAGFGWVGMALKLRQ